MDLALVFFYIYNKFLLYSTQVCYRTLDIVLLFMYCYYKKQSSPSMCISTYICNHTGLIQLTKLHCYAWQCLPKYVQQTKTQALTFFFASWHHHSNSLTKFSISYGCSYTKSNKIT